MMTTNNQIETAFAHDSTELSLEDLAKVTGVVMLDGKPMPEALVEFLPDSDKGTHGAVSGGTTDEEGRSNVSERLKPSRLLTSLRFELRCQCTQ